MKKFLLFLFIAQPRIIATQISYAMVNQEIMCKNHVDDLLEEALHDGIHQETMKPRELAWYEIWIRNVGGALFIKCLAVRNYVKKIIAFES